MYVKSGGNYMISKYWEIHELEGKLVFVEINTYASRCLYMDDVCEQVVAVRVFNNPSPYTPPTEEIEKGGEEIYEIDE